MKTTKRRYHFPVLFHVIPETLRVPSPPRADDAKAEKTREELLERLAFSVGQIVSEQKWQKHGRHWYKPFRYGDNQTGHNQLSLLEEDLAECYLRLREQK